MDRRGMKTARLFSLNNMLIETAAQALRFSTTYCRVVPILSGIKNQLAEFTNIFVCVFLRAALTCSLHGDIALRRCPKTARKADGHATQWAQP